MFVLGDPLLTPCRTLTQHSNFLGEMSTHRTLLHAAHLSRHLRLCHDAISVLSSKNLYESLTFIISSSVPTIHDRDLDALQDLDVRVLPELPARSIGRTFWLNCCLKTGSRQIHPCHQSFQNCDCVTVTIIGAKISTPLKIQFFLEPRFDAHQLHRVTVEDDDMIVRNSTQLTLLTTYESR